MPLLSRIQQDGEPPSGHDRPAGSEGPAAPAARGYNEERARELKQRIQRRLLADLRVTKKKEKPKGKARDEADQAAGRKLQQEEKKRPARLGRPTHDDSEEMRQRIEELFNTILAEDRILLNRSERRLIFEMIVADLLGFGPLEGALADQATTDILVVGVDRVFVERNGRIMLTNIRFDNEDHLLHVIGRVLSPLGRRVDETSPMVDARMPDGSRVNAVIPPVALDGPCLTIRKFSEIPLKVQDLIDNGTATGDAFEFLNAVVKAQTNILISGGSGSGKTTLLNVLSDFIPHDERIVTIENAAELQLQQGHVVRLEARPANVEGEGEIGIREMTINALRMRPDRIILGEARGPEAVDLVQAMITGQEGSMSTIHSNSAVDALSRLETMVLTAGTTMHINAIREQIAAAVDIVVHMARLRDGSRRIVSICEVEGMEGDNLMVSELFSFEQTGRGPEGEVRGYLRPTGLIPRCLDRMDKMGIRLSPSIFGQTSFDGSRRPMKEFIRKPEPEPEPDQDQEPGPGQNPASLLRDTPPV